MIVWTLLLLASAATSAVASDSESADDTQLKVETTHGWLQGSHTYTRGGRKIKQWLGIQYAKSPEGELSFKNPEPVDPWDGVINATVECDLCIQQFAMLEATRYIVQGSANSLCMNIWCPYVDDQVEADSEKHKFPTIFYIYGSAYTGLDPRKAFYGPEKLLDKNVCLVVAAHRLGIAGFLSTEDEVIPGNFGLKDQALALKWVKQNIHKFGGDPDSITLMGESSGAGSVHLHLFSPLTRDLFHRAIIESGSGYCPWGFAKPGEHKKHAYVVGKHVGCTSEDSKELLTCLQNTPLTRIMNVTHKITESKKDFDPVAFPNPVIELAAVAGAFLTENPYHLCSKKPLLAGFNYAEGMMKMASLTSGDIEGKFKEWNENFEKITPPRMLYHNRFDESELANVTKKVRKFYFGANNKEVKPNMIKQCVDAFGEFWFKNGVIDAVEKHCGPKWLYHFNYNTSLSVPSSIYGTNVTAGAAHLDELMYMFPMNIPALSIFDNKTTPEYILSVKMVDMWTNFVKNGVPTADGVTWDPVKSAALEHLVITNRGFTMDNHPIKKSRKFWKSLNSLAIKTDKEIVAYS